MYGVCNVGRNVTPSPVALILRLWDPKKFCIYYTYVLFGIWGCNWELLFSSDIIIYKKTVRVKFATMDALSFVFISGQNLAYYFWVLQINFRTYNCINRYQMIYYVNCLLNCIVRFFPFRHQHRYLNALFEGRRFIVFTISLLMTTVLFDSNCSRKP